MPGGYRYSRGRQLKNYHFTPGKLPNSFNWRCKAARRRDWRQWNTVEWQNSRLIQPQTYRGDISAPTYAIYCPLCGQATGDLAMCQDHMKYTCHGVSHSPSDRTTPTGVLKITYNQALRLPDIFEAQRLVPRLKGHYESYIPTFSPRKCTRSLPKYPTPEESCTPLLSAPCFLSPSLCVFTCKGDLLIRDMCYPCYVVIPRCECLVEEEGGVWRGRHELIALRKSRVTHHGVPSVECFPTFAADCLPLVGVMEYYHEVGDWTLLEVLLAHKGVSEDILLGSLQSGHAVCFTQCNHQ